MNTANNNIIDTIKSKAILLTLLQSDEHKTLKTALTDERGTGVTLLEFSTGDYAVLDKTQEGTYMTYLFEELEEADSCFETCASQWDTD